MKCVSFQVKLLFEFAIQFVDNFVCRFFKDITLIFLRRYLIRESSNIIIVIIIYNNRRLLDE